MVAAYTHPHIHTHTSHAEPVPGGTLIGQLYGLIAVVTARPRAPAICLNGAYPFLSPYGDMNGGIGGGGWSVYPHSHVHKSPSQI